MPVTIVVGGQFGSEGKGKVVALIARSKPIGCVVRCGGPNSGHTTSIDGEDVVLRQLPASIGVNECPVAIAAGAVVDEEVLLDELIRFEIHRERVIVDPRAVVVTAADKERERELVSRIGSTGSGNGQAIVNRIGRVPGCLAENSVRLKEFARVETVAPYLHGLIENRERVLIEGTQGFGLSLFHSSHYPKVTSKDTTASAFASEAGVSPRDVDEVIMVVRTFPIRVAGDSGELVKETSWEAIQEFSGAPTCEREFTSVTKNERRVGGFDFELIKKAVAYNRPTSLAIMGLDRINFQNRGVESASQMTEDGVEFISALRNTLGVPVSWVGTGFETFAALAMEDSFASEVSNAR